MTYKPCIILLLLALAILAAGCTAPQTVPSATNALPDQVVQTPDLDNDQKLPESTSESDRYYYNIKIIPPSALKQLEKELRTDEYLIYNDNKDLIGVVSPRFLYIRGDLVQIAQGGGERAGREFDKIDIAEHLVDITFGFDNSRLILFKKDKDYKFWFDAYYTSSDLAAAREFAKFFNSLSDTTQFEDDEIELGFLKSNYAEIPYNFYNIRIIPEKMLDDFKKNRADNDHLMKKSDGTLIGIASDTRLFLLDTLQEDERRYYIWKGVLYSMGMHGTSFNDRESFFFRESGLNKNLSALDSEAVKLLYGGRLRAGMDLEETKKTLGLTA